MATPTEFLIWVGNWYGPTTLHMAWAPPGEQQEISDSVLTVVAGSNGQYLVFDWNWAYKGEPQSSHLTLIWDAELAQPQAAWVDSWHQNGALMVMDGVRVAEGVRLNGFFPAGDGPDWGWRIELLSKGEALKMIMTVISPEGEEGPAVDAEYVRQL